MSLKRTGSPYLVGFLVVAATAGVSISTASFWLGSLPPKANAVTRVRLCETPAQVVARYFPESCSEGRVAQSGRLESTFPASFADSLRIRSHRVDVAARPVGANAASTLYIDENGRRTYRDGFPGCDVVYHESSGVIEEFLIVRHSREEKRRWTWELNLGVDDQRLGPMVSEDGSIQLLDKDGVARLHIDPPFGKDANGVRLVYGERLRYDMLAKPGGRFDLTLTASLSNLDYPVVIDPTWRAEARIIDGTNVPDSQFPTVGEVGDSGSGYYCTGTLIAADCVLTAGHCYTNSSGTLVVGQTAGRFRLGGTVYQSTSIVVHPTYAGFDGDTEDQFDFIVMKLSTSVMGVTPSPLYRDAPGVGLPLTIAGYGYEGTGATGHNFDTPASGTINFGITPIDIVTNTFIKWNFEDNTPKESNTAPGDSGGPGFIEVDGVLVVAAATSGGYKANASWGDLSYDPRVDAVVAWIDTQCGTSGGTNNPPSFTATASASKTSLGRNESATFSAAATDPEDTVVYTWYFSDGTSKTGAGVSHSFSEAGTYRAAVLASDGNQRAVTSYVDVTVVNRPPAFDTPATASKTTALIGENVDFSAVATDPDGDTVAYAWDFGDGNNGTGSNVTHAFAAGGVFTVEVTIDDGNGETATSTVDVTVLNSAPTFDSPASASKTLTIVGENVDFSASATDPDGDTVSYSWNFGDGSSGTGSNVTHAFAAGGLFTVEVTATDGNGGSATSTVQVRVADGNMALTKALINLRFNKQSLDKAQINVTLTFVRDITLAGETLSFDIGGVTGQVVLDNKEKAPRGLNEKVRIKIRGHKKGTLVSAGTQATVTLMVKKGDFRAQGLALGGVADLNADTEKAGVAGTLTATLQFGTQLFIVSDRVGTYKARQDVKGRFKIFR